MKQYPKYKDSGIQWIGQVPAEWSIVPLKTLLSLLTDGTHQTPTYLDKGIPFVSIKDMSSGKLDFSDAKYISQEEHELLSKHAPVAKGDILFSRIGTLGVFIKVETDEVFDIFVSLGLMKIIPDAINTDFLVYYLSSDTIRKYIDIVKAGEGTSAAKFNLTDVSKTPVLLPSSSEQQAIVDFLDSKISKIDKSVSLLEQQKADLQVYRTALISEIFTKDGIKMLPLKYFLKDEGNNLRVGPFGSALSGSDFKREGIWVYNQRCVLDNNFKTNDTFVDEEKYEELKSFEVYPNDVLITTRGTIGKIAIVSKDAPKGILHPCLIRCKIDFDKIHPSILVHLFNDSDFVINQLRMKSNATTIDVVYSYSLKNIMLPVLSKEEQKEIVDILDSKTAKIDEAIGKIDEQIDDLKAYRTALITEAVTGKMDVRLEN